MGIDAAHVRDVDLPCAVRVRRIDLPVAIPLARERDQAARAGEGGGGGVEGERKQSDPEQGSGEQPNLGHGRCVPLSVAGAMGVPAHSSIGFAARQA